LAASRFSKDAKLVKGWILQGGGVGILCGEGEGAAGIKIVAKRLK